jgi:hypothetical protein
MACHGVISAGFCRNRFCIKLEITPPSISNHSRYGTCATAPEEKSFNPIPGECLILGNSCLSVAPQGLIAAIFTA